MNLLGIDVRVSHFVPPGTVIATNGRIFVESNYVVLKLRHDCDPLYSRYTLGAKEARRDARHHH